jgi:hypothetical protein
MPKKSTTKGTIIDDTPKKSTTKATIIDDIRRVLKLDGYRKTYLAEHIRGLIRIYGLGGIKSDGALGLLYDILFIDNITTNHFSQFQEMWTHRSSELPEHVEWWSVFRAFVRDCFNTTRDQMNRFYRESHPKAAAGTKWFPQPAKMEAPKPDVGTPPIQIRVQLKRGLPAGGGQWDAAAPGNPSNALAPPDPTTGSPPPHVTATPPTDSPPATLPATDGPPATLPATDGPPATLPATDAPPATPPPTDGRPATPPPTDGPPDGPPTTTPTLDGPPVLSGGLSGTGSAAAAMPVALEPSSKGRKRSGGHLKRRQSLRAKRQR